MRYLKSSLNYWLNTPGAPILLHHDEISQAGGASWHSSSCSHSVQKEQLSRKSQLIIGISWCTNMCTNTVQLAFTFIFIFSIEPIYDTLRWSNICASVRKWQLQELSRISRELCPRRSVRYSQTIKWASSQPSHMSLKLGFSAWKNHSRFQYWLLIYLHKKTKIR